MVQLVKQLSSWKYIFQRKNLPEKINNLTDFLFNKTEVKYQKIIMLWKKKFQDFSRTFALVFSFPRLFFQDSIGFQDFPGLSRTSDHPVYLNFLSTQDNWILSRLRRKYLLPTRRPGIFYHPSPKAYYYPAPAIFNWRQNTWQYESNMKTYYST